MKLNYKLLTLFCLAILVVSCNDDFDGELATNPTQVSLNTFYSSPEAVNSAITGVYGYLTTPRNLGVSGKGMYMHHRTDEMSSGSDYAVTGQYNPKLTPSFYTVTQPWALMFTAIFGATDVITNIGQVEFEDTALQDAYLGEAHMLRAFAHFYLLVNFENIPIMTELPLDSSEYIRPQVEPSVAWDFIIADLITAKGLLPNKDFWDSANTGRMTSGAATGLLGKVYLTRSGIEGVNLYSEAAAEFSELINGTHGSYGLTADYTDNFGIENENNIESVLEFQFVGDGDLNTGFNPGSSSSGLFSDPRGFAPPGLRCHEGCEAIVHDWLYDTFVASIDNDGKTDRRMFGTLVFDDMLLANGIPDLNNDGDFTNDRLALNAGHTFEEVYFEDGTFGGKLTSATNYKAANRKWLDWNLNIEGENENQDDRFKQSRAHGANWRFIRYADVLLMYAEAVLNGGAESAGSALDAVNVVRDRANVPALGALDMNTLKAERILEVSLEGHRGLDLLRWGEFFTRFSTLEGSDSNFKGFDTSTYATPIAGKNEYLPIPIDELAANPTAVQNPGW